MLRLASFNRVPKISEKLFKNYFKLFDLPLNANDKQIKSAYLLTAKKFHPDMNDSDPLAQEKFMKVAEGYKILKDQKLKQEYIQNLVKQGILDSKMVKNYQKKSSLEEDENPKTEKRKTGLKNRKSSLFDRFGSQCQAEPARKYSQAEIRQEIKNWQNLFEENFYYQDECYKSGKNKRVSINLEEAELASSWSKNFLSKKGVGRRKKSASGKIC